MFTVRYEWKRKKVIWMDLNYVCSELLVKCKIHHVTRHEDSDREKMYRPTISLASALDRDGWLTPRPGSLPPGLTRYPLYRRLGGPLERVYNTAKNLAPTAL